MQPVIKTLGKIGRFEIERVDGAWIRKNLDPDFTNWGQHFRQTYIPKYKIWLDQEATPDEEVFFLSAALVMHQQMSAGKKYEEALKVANAVERKERGKKLVSDRKPLPPELLAKVVLDDLGGDGVRVKLVDGKLIRDKVDPNFTEGGHDLVYPYIPHGTVWLDNDLMPQDAQPTLVHEVGERKDMADGMAYPPAHRRALGREWAVRHRYSID